MYKILNMQNQNAVWVSQRSEQSPRYCSTVDSGVEWSEDPISCIYSHQSCEGFVREHKVVENFSIVPLVFRCSIRSSTRVAQGTNDVSCCHERFRFDCFFYIQDSRFLNLLLIPTHSNYKYSHLDSKSLFTTQLHYLQLTTNIIMSARSAQPFTVD